MPVTEISNAEEFETKVFYIVPEESGDYHLGFHAVSDAGQYYLYVANISLIATSPVAAPNKVQDLQATPAPKGELKVTLDFKAPNLTVDEKPLTDLSEIKIYRKGTAQELTTLAVTEPSAVLSYVDENALQGDNEYYVVAANKYGTGLTDTISVYAGIGIPMPVKNFTIKDVNGAAKLSWEAPTEGVDGNYIDPEMLTYSIVRNDKKVIATNIRSLEFTDTDIDASKGQLTVYYQIIATSTIGSSAHASSNFVIFGAPYATPFNESFADASVKKGPWTISKLNGDVTWLISNAGKDPSIESYDGDNGLLTFNSYDGKGDSRINTPKLDFSKMKNPKISFYMYHYKGEDSIQVEVSSKGAEFKAVGEKFGNKQDSGTKEWVKHIVSLGEYAGSDNVIVALHGYSDYDNNIHLDNIKIEDYLDYDLAGDIDLVSGSNDVNSTITYDVTVTNKGAQDSGDYTVEFYCNNVKVADAAGTSLVAEDSKTFEFETKLLPKDAGKDITCYAKVISDIDMNLYNNTTEEICYTVNIPKANAPKALSAVKESNHASLTWDIPDETLPVSTVDDVEDYEPFAIDNIGEWTMVDVDKGSPYFLSDENGKALNYNHDTDPRAFQVFDNNVDAACKDYIAHSGSQFFIAVAVKGVANNDWMISPKAEPGTTVSFYAKALSSEYQEHFNVYYSSTDKDVESFKPINSQEGEIAADDWTCYSYTLPADAKYFAINYNSNDAFALMIDDISYTNAPFEAALEGYNVYRNDEKINETVVPVCEYVDASKAVDSADRYNVTALYDKCESAYSNDASAIVSGTESVSSTDLIAYGMAQTICVKGAAGKDVNVYNVDGKLVVSAKNVYNTTFAVSSGVYLVEVATKTIKVVVK